MRCRFVRQLAINTRTAPPALMAIGVAATIAGKPETVIPPGATYEHPLAWLWVRQGCAVPADEECRKEAGLTDEQMGAAQKSFDRTVAGIHPEDFELYERGVIVGYDRKGGYLPGPHWEQYQAEKAAADQAEEW